jgi:Molybdopterin oxidoreductase Fe4S4 domain
MLLAAPPAIGRGTQAGPGPSQVAIWAAARVYSACRHNAVFLVWERCNRVQPTLGARRSPTGEPRFGDRSRIWSIVCCNKFSAKTDGYQRQALSSWVTTDWALARRQRPEYAALSLCPSRPAIGGRDAETRQLAAQSVEAMPASAEPTSLVSVDRLDVRSGGHQSTGVGVATYALACVSHVLHEEVHQWNLIRRDFIVLSGSSLTASSIGALGFGAAADARAAAAREFKLSRATETRNTCTYCSVGCGILIYSLGDRAKNVKPLIRHRDQPVLGEPRREEPCRSRQDPDGGAQGRPWNPSKPILEWNGTHWAGIDVPDYPPTTVPEASVGPFIMIAEGVARLFACDALRDGPFPEHYEPFSSLARRGRAMARTR